MKNITRRIIIGSALFVALWTAQNASAWYDPSTGRWLTRDPIGEPGFEVLRRVQPVPQPASIASSPNRWIHRDSPANENRYLFVQNNPANAIDPDGLKCVLMSNGMVVDTDKQKVVFWSSDPNATAKFIAECNFKKKLPIIGACLIFFGGGPSTPHYETESCTRIALSVDENGELYCTFNCTKSGLYSASGGECLKSYFLRVVPK